MLTAQDRFKELPKVIIHETGFGSIREKVLSSASNRKQASHTLGCNSAYSCKSISRNFSTSSVFKLVSEKRTQQNSVLLKRQDKFKQQIRTILPQ
jgi:hypothetical protein